RRENGGFIPYDDPLWEELEENTPYNYRMWLIAKMCYAYALDTYTSGDESIFLHDEVVDQAIKKALKISDDDDVPTPLDTKQRKALLSEISELVGLSLPDEPDDLERQEQELEELIAKQQRMQGLEATPPKDEQQTQELIANDDPQDTYIPDDWQTPDDALSDMAFAMCEAQTDETNLHFT
ncbi:hypothetical protein, partial [Helicobacter suis]